MTAERKPSEIADALITLLGRLDGIDSGSPVTVARTNLANYVADHRDTILAALRSAAPPRGEPVDEVALINVAEHAMSLMLSSRDGRDELMLWHPCEGCEVVLRWLQARGKYLNAVIGPTVATTEAGNAAPSAGRDAEDAPTPDGNSTK